MAAAPTLPDPATSGRPVLGAVRIAREALSDCSPSRLWALSEPEVSEAMRVLGELALSVSALRVAVLCEAKSRSLGSGDGWGPVDWARACAPLTPLRELTDAQVVAGAGEDLRPAPVVSAVLDGAQPGLADDRVQGCGALPVGKAAQIIRFHNSLRGMAAPDLLDGATRILLEASRGADGHTERELATAIRYAGLVMRPDTLDDEEEVARGHRSLVKGKGPLGLSRYTWILDEEGAAIVDAAVDALAKPTPDQETGQHDRRPPETRRADALLDLVARAVGAPNGVPQQAKTTLVVKIGLEELQGRCRGAGLTSFGEVLSTDVVRRLACDAQVVPVVLGTRGEILDQGEAIRLFNRSQIRHLWLRDKHCTFPGCHKPAAWTDAHHLLHWAHGGPTDTWNAALLCRAHHSVVHTHRYAGRVVEGAHGPFVQWDLTRGSYDAMLAAHKTRFAYGNTAGNAVGDHATTGEAPPAGAPTGAATGAATGAGSGRRLDVAAYREWVAQAWPFQVLEPHPRWGFVGGPAWGAGPVTALVGATDNSVDLDNCADTPADTPVNTSGPPRP